MIVSVNSAALSVMSPCRTTRLPTRLNAPALVENERPLSAVSVLVFAEDRRQLPGRAQWMKPDQLGRFVVSGLPSGIYLVALTADVDDTRWSAAEYLDAFRAQAVRVTLRDAEKKSLDLQWSEPR